MLILFPTRLQMGHYWLGIPVHTELVQQVQRSLFYINCARWTHFPLAPCDSNIHHAFKLLKGYSPFYFLHWFLFKWCLQELHVLSRIILGKTWNEMFWQKPLRAKFGGKNTHLYWSMCRKEKSSAFSCCCWNLEMHQTGSILNFMLKISFSNYYHYKK